MTYGLIILLMMVGMYLTIADHHLIKKLIGINIFQVGIFFLFILMGYIDGATPPVYSEAHDLYASPLPHVLILTAIVVSISTTAVGLALVIRIHAAFNNLDEMELLARVPK